MKKLGIIAAVVALLIGGSVTFIGAWIWYINLPDHYYRLTLEAETPDGTKSASSVLAVYFHHVTWGLPEATGLHAGLKGEAVFLDLGHGHNVVALLAHGPKAQNVTSMLGVDGGSFARIGQPNTWDETKDLKGIAPVPANLVPTLVTISDINDPKSIRVIRPEDFASVFGPGYRFKGATVEIVKGPRTRGIEQKLPFLITHRDELMRSWIMTAEKPYIPHFGHFKIGR